MILIFSILFTGAKGVWDFRISDMVKTLMKLIFNHCGEFRWSPEGPVSQFHSPHLLAGAPGNFSDLLRSVQMLKREWGAERNGNLPHLFILSKTAILVPEFAVEDLPSAELQPWFLRLQWAELILQTFGQQASYIYLHYGNISICTVLFLYYIIIIIMIRVFCPRAGLTLQTQEPRLQFYKG